MKIGFPAGSPSSRTLCECQPGFFNSIILHSVSNWWFLSGSLSCSHHHTACVTYILMVTPLVKMLKLVFKLADTDRKEK